MLHTCSGWPRLKTSKPCLISASAFSMAVRRSAADTSDEAACGGGLSSGSASGGAATGGAVCEGLSPSASGDCGTANAGAGGCSASLGACIMAERLVQCYSLTTDIVSNAAMTYLRPDMAVGALGDRGSGWRTHGTG